MKGKAFGLLTMVSVGALVACGCAKKDMVKQDEPLASPSAVTAAAPAPAPQQPKIAEQKKVQNAAPADRDLQQKAAKEAAAKAATAEQVQKELQTIYFGFDSSKLSDEARGGLVKDAELIKKLAKETVRVEGNCDERGSDDYNLALGEKRAKEAVQYLTNLGIPADRLTSVSYGKEKPVAPGHDEASWAKNRRDNFVVVQ